MTKESTATSSGRGRPNATDSGKPSTAAPSTTMQRKKLDSRIPLLISNGVKQNHRSFFVLVGDRGKDQVVTLHFLLSKARVTARPSVLWCYKKELGFTTHKKKRMNQIKRQIARGIREPDAEDPFELFVTSTDIRYAYYKETENILGNTYGMCILQDFEAITPNILARTIETVEGGGIVVILLKTMSSLKQLYTMTMDVHARYRTESHHDTVARFNERFLLSLGNCNTCLVLDDELNVLPISSGKDVKPISKISDNEETPEQNELKELKASLADTQPVGALVSCAKTVDQAKAILTFVESIAEKTMRSTVALTASRGRGKSAALGISLASAIAYGYSNIFITSPSPENLNTLFEFCLKAFTALGYEEHLDYDVVKSTQPALQKCIVRINVFRDHRQTIQYIAPTEHQSLSQAELVVIDEAAAIPLPVIKKLLGPYLVFMASTINGYEGTGRSLSLKLFQQLREQSMGFSAKKNDEKKEGNEKSSSAARVLREIQLTTPIRYSSNDCIEKWLNNLLCLDCCNPTGANTSSSGFKGLGGVGGCPHPSVCDLYYVNRDTLFSYHPVGETFLQRMMNLYVASHYKNSPNDLQLMSDAPAHHLFVLLPPVSTVTASTLPDPIVVIQVCMEGAIAKESALASLAKGLRQAGDLIPWVVSQQFQESDFASLSGARVVRIATHPDYIGMGYGKRAIEMLEDYYRGNIVNMDENLKENEVEISRISDADLENTILQKDEIKIKDPSKMPPLLLKLSERPLKASERLHWFGVSYGLTPQLQKFWNRLNFIPVYVRQTANELTGEHTCIMIKSLIENDQNAITTFTKDSVLVGKSTWLGDFACDFKKRFMELLSYQLRVFSASTVLGIFEASDSIPAQSRDNRILIDNKQELNRHYSPYDLKRLASYSQNLLDYHVIQDLVPLLAKQYFLGLLQTFKPETNTFEGVQLSAVQSAILCGMGLQKKYVEDLEKELGLSVSQVLALFAKTIKKCSNYFEALIEGCVRKELEQQGVITNYNAKKKDANDDEAWDPTAQTLMQDLEEGEEQVMNTLKEKQVELINSLDLSLYEIQGKDKDWEKVKIGKGSNVVNIPSENSTKKRKPDVLAADLSAELRGDKNGVYDPKGLSTKDKSKKRQKKQKN